MASFPTRRQLKCLVSCNNDASCLTAAFNSATLVCKLYRRLLLSGLVASPSSTTFVRIATNSNLVSTSVTAGLINYWPINTDMSDYVGDSDLIPMTSVNLASDRFGNPNSALFLNSGYCSVKPGVYFHETFTITIWVEPLSTGSYFNTVLDFSNGLGVDNVYLSYSNKNVPSFFVYDKFAFNNYTFSNISVNVGVWNHLALTMDESTVKIYVNATLARVASFLIKPTLVTRNSCLFGRSSWYPSSNNPDANAYFDDIRIYNTALDQNQINTIYIGL